jgi:hypothetical protein
VYQKQQAPRIPNQEGARGLFLLAMTARLGSSDDRLLNGIQEVESPCFPLAKKLYHLIGSLQNFLLVHIE